MYTHGLLNVFLCIYIGLIWLSIYSLFSNIHLVHTNADDIADMCRELICVTNSDTSRTHYVHPIS